MKRVVILNTNISAVNYNELIEFSSNIIDNGKKVSVAYANVNSINLCVSDKKYKKDLDLFDLVYPDGIGVYLASKILHGKKGFEKRINASDFLLKFIEHIIKSDLSVFIFGDHQQSYNRIKEKYPGLKIKGYSSGYDLNLDSVIEEINKSKPQILIVGLGSPLQENVIAEIKNFVNVNIILSVGQGIKLLAGNKIRGPKIIRYLGFEWLVRLFAEPKRLFKRYIIGNPVFIYRIFKYKLIERNEN